MAYGGDLREPRRSRGIAQLKRKLKQCALWFPRNAPLLSEAKAYIRDLRVPHRIRHEETKKKVNECSSIYQRTTTFSTFQFPVFGNKNTQNDFFLFSEMGYFSKYFQISKQTYFHCCFLFSVKMETENDPTKQGLSFLYLFDCVSSTN